MSKFAENANVTVLKAITESNLEEKQEWFKPLRPDSGSITHPS